MDFFAHQDEARRKTGLLIGYYVLAVILIALGVYLAFTAAFVGIKLKTEVGASVNVRALWHPELFLWVVGGTLLIVVVGTWYKIHELGGGGESVARMLGGQPINPNTTDRDERRLLNVVEEMAIASGTPVPVCFLLASEESINAFAAGFSPSDAVIGVTRGCLTTLSRDELQGVVAHEFSHILNGDMRLNIRLIGVLNGILVIGILGFWIFRSSLYGGRSRSSKEKGNMPIVLLGLAVMVIGYVGVLFGKLIKSAVSRQREFLADASAIQFTRNPGGMSGALKKIGGWAKSSGIKERHAEEASHLFFANALSGAFMNLFSTHPPLRERIRRIDPSFSGSFAKTGGRESGAEGVAGVSALAGGGAASAKVERFNLDTGEVMARVGAPQQEHLAYAAELVASFPPELTEAAHEPFGARAVVYCLLLNKEADARKAQMARLAKHADPPVYEETLKIMPLVEAMGHEVRLPLVDMAISALRGLSEIQYQGFMENVRHLVAADEKLDIFEFALERIIRRRLEPVFHKTQRAAVQFYSMKPLLPRCVELLSALAYWGNGDAAGAQTAFAKGAKKLKVSVLIRMAPPEACGLDALDAALVQLALASPSIKKRLLEACITCIGADGQVTVEEAELLRAVGDALDCPVPPFLPGQAV